jgi:hypothetical protein
MATAHRARTGVANAAGIGAERVLGALARAPGDDEGWVNSVAAFASLQSAYPAPATDRPEIAALIVFGPPVSP